MINRILIGASLACANPLNLEEDLRNLESCDIDFLHYDVMDGHFVPNFALNVDLVSSVKKATRMPINVHLMITNPAEYIDRFIEAGCDSLSFHQETTPHSQRLISIIKGAGIKAGLAINPATPLNVLDSILPELDFILIMTVNPGFSGQKLVPLTIEKISTCKTMLTERGLNIPIQVDGNVSFENIPKMVRAGASMLVCGTSSLFTRGMDIYQATRKIKSILTNVQEFA